MDLSRKRMPRNLAQVSQQSVDRAYDLSEAVEEA